MAREATEAWLLATVVARQAWRQEAPLQVLAHQRVVEAVKALYQGGASNVNANPVSTILHSD